MEVKIEMSGAQLEFLVSSANSHGKGSDKEMRARTYRLDWLQQL